MHINDSQSVTRIKRILYILKNVLLVIILIVVIWFGSAVYKTTVAHKSLTETLTSDKAIRSNSIYPKRYISRSAMDKTATISFYLKHPFTSERRLIYVKGTTIVCQAIRKSQNEKWYLDIPVELRFRQKQPTKPDDIKGSEAN